MTVGCMISYGQQTLVVISLMMKMVEKNGLVQLFTRKVDALPYINNAFAFYILNT